MELSADDETETAGVGVTTGFLARKVGVSPTTLRSWDRRYGLGPAVRADGRHRRWSPDDVAMVREMCRLTAAGLPPAEAARAAKEAARGRVAASPALTARKGTAARTGAAARTRTAGRTRAAAGTGTSASARTGLRVPDGASATAPGPGTPESPAGAEPSGTGPSGTGPAPGDAAQESRGLAHAAVRLDAHAVQARLAAAVRTHGLARAWEDVMVPALRAVGRKWEASGDRYVEVEHLLTWHVSATLRHAYVSAAGDAPPAAASPVLLACVPGEQHTLPLEALNAALAERGVPAVTLGGAVPPEALIAAVQRVGPPAVVLWSQSWSTANLPLARHIAATRWGVRGARTRSRILLSGPGWNARPGPGLLRPRHLAEALHLITAPDDPTTDPRTPSIS
ncbi:MerR family transcriptional regulator [Streptomyces sp. NPDC058122]|uniref:MerR family transcriptional regulator n=1 Tax=Streptomyces sp. NPDC058122 TaxID=3346349 RepID=UPI0036EB5DA2